MQFIVVVNVRPRPHFLNLLLNDREDFFNSFVNGYHNNQFQVFNNPFQSRRYLRQNPEDSFLSFSFADQFMRALQDVHNFFHSLHQMTYHAPQVPQRVIRFQPRVAQYNIYDEDRTFLAAQAQRMAPRPSTNLIQSADKIPTAKLAKNAKLPVGIDHNAEGLLDAVTMDRTKDLVCVKTAMDSKGNPMYQVYDRHMLFEVYKRSHGASGSFKDPNTNQFINIKDVFRINYDDFTKHLREQNKPVVPQAHAEPAVSARQRSRVGGR